MNQWKFIKILFGILRDKTMNDKVLKAIPNDDKQNYPFFRLIVLVENFEEEIQ